jgi:hypothetical protein
MLKRIKKCLQRGHQRKITGWPYFITMMFFVIFLLQLVILLILIKIT